MLSQVEPLHFYQSKGGEICMVIFATRDEVLYVSYESDVPGLVETVTRNEFAKQHEREILRPDDSPAPSSRTFH